MESESNMQYYVRKYKEIDEDWNHLYWEKQAHCFFNEEDYLEFCAQTGETPA